MSPPARHGPEADGPGQAADSAQALAASGLSPKGECWPAQHDGTALSLRWLDAGDGALTIEFGDVIAPHLVARVAALDKVLAAARARGELPGVVETMPTLRSLTLLYDPLQTSRAMLDPALKALLLRADPAQAVQAAAQGRRWRLPVCTAASLAPTWPMWRQPPACRLMPCCSCTPIPCSAST